jgi:hypothetical protein
MGDWSGPGAWDQILIYCTTHAKCKSHKKEPPTGSLSYTFLLDLDNLTVHHGHGSIPLVGLGIMWTANTLLTITNRRTHSGGIDRDFFASDNGFFKGLLGLEVDIGVHWEHPFGRGTIMG